MRKLVLIGAIALVTGISVSQPSPADPPGPECLICGTSSGDCYSHWFGMDCSAPAGVPLCTDEQVAECLGR